MLSFNKVFSSLITVVWSALAVYAQDGPSKQQMYTLGQCIEYALQNGIQMKNAELDKRISKARVKEIVGAGLPQLDIEAHIVHNPKLQRFFTTYDPNAPASFLDFSRISGINPGDVVGIRNFFQLKSSADATLRLTQILFNGSYTVGLMTVKLYNNLAAQLYEDEQNKVVEQVSKAYYAVLLNKERLALFDANIARLDMLLRNTKALYENGFVEQIDIDRIQVSRNNLQAEFEKFNHLTNVVLNALKIQMNYPFDAPLELAGTLSDLQLEQAEPSPEQIDYTLRTDYRLLETNIRFQHMVAKNEMAQALPSLIFSANLGYNTQSPSIGGLFSTRSQFKENEQAGIGPDKWYLFSSLGLSLKIPLFSGLQRSKKVQQEKLRILKLENDKKRFEQGIQLEVEQVNTQYDYAKKSVQIQKQNKDLASHIAQVTQKKYEQGVGSNLEILQAESSLREAQVNYYTALYDMVVAKLDRDKAYGLILKR